MYWAGEMWRRGQRGQALVEWAVFGTAILILWAASLTCARRLLARTAAESWSVLAARKTLSGLSTAAPAGLALNSRRGPGQARTDAWLEGAHSRFSLAIPRAGADRSRSSSWFSGFRLPLSSE